MLARRENAVNDERSQTDSNAATNAGDSDSNSSNANAQNQAADTDESARSDKLANGGIKGASLRAGDGDVKITVNVPAFTLTLWQNGKEIKSYFVGVGRKNYPIPIGMRSADQIILNPNWIPPEDRPPNTTEPILSIKEN